MTEEEAIKTLKENICAQCAYGSNMENCDIRYCDSKDAIEAIEALKREPCEDVMKCPYQTRIIHQPEVVDEHGRINAEDITVFGECVGDKCPFYYHKKVFGNERTGCGRADAIMAQGIISITGGNT